mgnify:CR=1 FL=1
MRLHYRSLTIPQGCHPLVRELFEEMHAQRCGARDMADRSGVNVNTLKDWRTRTQPRIADLEACFNVLGYTLRPVERKS